MPKYRTEEIRNVALVGHSGSGKTILAEALLFAAQETTRFGEIAAGTTVSDFEREEQEGGKSINCTPLHFAWQGREFNLLDTAGYTEFIGSGLAGLSVVETALLAVNGMAGVEVMTRKYWEVAGALGLARAFVITRLDAENAKFDEVVAQLRRVFGTCCLPVTLPLGLGTSLSGVEYVLGEPEKLSAAAQAARRQVIEAAVATDDALMERYLEDVPLSAAELAGALAKALGTGGLVPIFAVAAQKSLGVAELAGFLAEYAPSPLAARPPVQVGEATEPLTPTASGKFHARIFKVTADEYVGKIGFFRIYSGRLKPGETIYTSASGRPETVAKLYRFQGKEQKEVSEALAGEIIAVAKLESLLVDETLAAEASLPRFARVVYPNPMVALAVSPKKQGDEARLSESLRRLGEEDPCFKAEYDSQTKELVIRGMGERHLRAVLSRMSRRFNVDVETRVPRIPYRETITGRAEDVDYTHKKQTGGAGQYAKVVITVEPNTRDAGYEFVDEIFGGSIDQPFRQSTDKGIRAKIAEGIFAGYPVVDIKVRLVDGKTHPVDSKDIAFQVAGREAIKKAFMLAKPVLLEPIVEMEIVVPARFIGDITGDLSSRRGRITGVETLGDYQVIRAEAPLAEVQGYSTQLQSVCGGEGYYAITPKRYDFVPSNIAQAIIARAHKTPEENGEK